MMPYFPEPAVACSQKNSPPIPRVLSDVTVNPEDITPSSGHDLITGDRNQ